MDKNPSQRGPRAGKSAEAELAPPLDGRPASLFLYPDRVIWASRGYQGRTTARPALSLIIGARSPVRIVLGRGDFAVPLQSRALLIDANVPRSLDARDAGFFSLNLDPLHWRCVFLRKRILSGRPVIDVAAGLGTDLAAQILAVCEHGADCAEALALSERVFDALFAEAASQAMPIDARVAATAAGLSAHLPVRPDLAALAKACNLSASRLVHLFKAELGVSIRSYLLWRKMHRAAQMFSENRSVTEVAAEIGFADSAHLSRVFRTYFAAAPSLLSNPAMVRVAVCG